MMIIVVDCYDLMPCYCSGLMMAVLVVLVTLI
jgi:hypothetical protein